LKTARLTDRGGYEWGLADVILPACDDHVGAKGNVTEAHGGSFASVTSFEVAEDGDFHGYVTESESLCTTWMTDDGHLVYETEIVIVNMT